MAVTEEPLLSKLDRLDSMLKRLEVMRGGNYNHKSSSPKSSYASSTRSSGTLTSDGPEASSLDLSPNSSVLAKHCRPINHVMMVTEVKGSLVERLDLVEDRILKLEQGLEAEKHVKAKISDKKSKKGFKRFVRSCVKLPNN